MEKDPRQIEMFSDFDGNRQAKWLVGCSPMDMGVIMQKTVWRTPGPNNAIVGGCAPSIPLDIIVHKGCFGENELHERRCLVACVDINCACRRSGKGFPR